MMAPNQTYDVVDVSCCVYTHFVVGSGGCPSTDEQSARRLAKSRSRTALLLPNWTECCRVKVLQRIYIIQVAVNTFPESSLLALCARSKRDQKTMNSPISLNQYDQHQNRAGRWLGDTRMLEVDDLIGKAIVNHQRGCIVDVCIAI